MVPQIVFHTEFSSLSGGLGHFVDSNSIPLNQPTIFHPSPIATILADVPSFTLRTALSAMPFVSDRWGVVKFDNSMINLHKMCKIPMNCQCKWLSAFLTARGTFVNCFPSPVKSLFCTDRTEPTEWQDLEQRQRIGDCLLIRIPHWGLCDRPLSSHQTFLLQVELRQCVFCKEPLSFWVRKQTSQFRSFGKWV